MNLTHIDWHGPPIRHGNNRSELDYLSGAIEDYCTILPSIQIINAALNLGDLEKLSFLCFTLLIIL